MISGTSATEEVRQLTYAHQNQPADWFAHPHDSPGTGKPGPLIGWPIRTVRLGEGRQDCSRVSRACALDTSRRIRNMGTECGLCEM